MLKDMTGKMKTIALADKLLFIKIRVMDDKKRDYEQLIKDFQAKKDVPEQSESEESL